MSTIAWDGQFLVSDRQSTLSDMKLSVSKIAVFPEQGKAVGWVASHESGLSLVDWYHEGADSVTYPAYQRDEHLWCRFIVATSERCFFYEHLPVIQLVNSRFGAWGSGMCYAIAAMEAGANAIEAVKIACKYDIYSGMGIDVCDLATMEVITYEFRGDYVLV